MDNVNLEYYIEISFIVIHKEISKDRFVLEFSLSEYEFNNDIKEIKKLSLKYGIEIIYKKEYIKYRICDENIFDSYSRSFFTFYYAHRYIMYSCREIILSLEISKQLLWPFAEDGSVNVDDLADSLNYSRSNLRTPLKICRHFLDSNNIEVKNIPYRGLKAEGSEFFKRKAMCAIINMIDINLIKNSNRKNIVDLFKKDNYSKIINIVNGTLTKYGYEILPIEQRRIIYYIIIQQSRIKNGNCIGDELYDENLNKDQDFYKLAHDIIKDLNKEFDFGEYPESEIMSLVVMLYDSGIDLKRVKDYIFENYYDIYLKFKIAIDNYLLDLYGVQISTTRHAYFYELILCRYAFKERFDVFKNMYQRFGGKSSLVYEYPLIKKTCFDLSEILQNTFNHLVPKSQIIQLCELFAYTILDKELVFPKLKICITSRNNHFEPYLVKDLILYNGASKYIERLDILNYFQITNNEKNAQKYDIILTDQLIGFTNKKNYDLNFVVYKESNGNIIKLEDIIKNKRNLVYKVVSKVVSMEFNPNDNDDIVVLRNKIVEYTDINLSLKCFEIKSGQYINDCAYYIFNDYFARDNVLIVGNLKKKIKIDNITVQNYVLFAGKIANENIKVINTLLFELVHNNSFLEKIIANEDLNDINDYLNLVIK